MNATQKTIKYVGMSFALLLSCAIIYSILSVGVNVLDLFLGGNSTEQFDKTYDAVSRIRVNNGTGRLIIKRGDALRVVGENVDRKFTAKLRGDSLEIKNENSVRGLWNGAIKQNRCVLTIYLPEQTNLKELNLEMGTGNAELRGFSTRKLELNVGVGNVNVQDVSADTLRIDGGVGDADAENISFNHLDIHGGVGNVTLNPIIGKQSEYNFDLDGGVGTIRVNGEKVSQKFKKHSGKYQQSGDTDKTLRIDGGVGNVELQFSQTD